jgi:hypothetical protein
MDITSEVEDRVLRALSIEVREPARLPIRCEQCKLMIVLDGRAGEMWHLDHEANMDHRPVYERYRGTLR